MVYDAALGLEALHLQGIMQPFPNHFHAYYVFGFIEKGRRQMLQQKQIVYYGAGGYGAV